MSFLASLREQTQSDTALTLCYLLSLDEPEQGIRLSLWLATLRDGRPVQQDVAYIIQRPHLKTPPPFLGRGDPALLQALADSDSEWLTGNAGRLPRHDPPGFLHGLLASNRCFFGDGDRGWRRVQAGPDLPVEAGWATMADGSQLPQWRCAAPGGRAYPCPDGAGPPLLWFRDSARLALGICKLDEVARRRFNSQPPIQAGDVQHFIGESGADWQAQGLPLPAQHPHQNHYPEPRPLLVCLPAHGDLPERLALVFQYQCPSLCCELPLGESSASCTFWTGESVVTIAPAPETERRHLHTIAPLLKGFVALPMEGHWRAGSPDSWRELLIERRPALAGLGCGLRIQAGFRHHYLRADNWQAELIREASDWELAVRVQADGEQFNLFHLLRELRQQRDGVGESVLRLEDGRLLWLGEAELDKLSQELADLLVSDRGRLPDSQIHRLHGLRLALPADTRWQGDLDALARADGLYDNPAVLHSRPRGLSAELRPYQWLGVCWLQHLRGHGVNGLLADDMGLGKTLQALAHLCLERQTGNLDRPALVVAPTSLLHNWSGEAARFAPELKTLVLHGPRRDRHWPELGQYQLVITSYALLVRDLPRWRELPLSWLILDEAQQIKNPRTRARGALAELHCPRKICLSGTPVENHLGELWSILDFLMPGCLGSERDFRQHYRQPIERDGDALRMQQLRERIAPFILRRDKDQVTRDLPARTEIEETITLGDEQREFYRQIKTESWESLAASLEREADRPGRQQVLLLNALLRLRQACCDPALLDRPDVDSAKRRHCVEMIAELAAEGRALLVFSQFTSMLDLLAGDLEARGIDHLMLTGASRNRQSLVEDFQAGRAPVFLISLKAGGVGLNLTRADTVIHFDPWWNQAAEQQAADRAHRIGQDKPVFIYKLIVEDSIEEKIARLQQRKALLGRHITDQGKISAAQFSLQLEELLALWEQE